MAIPVWPVSLPQIVLLDSYGETAQMPKYSVPTDNSMPIERPKTTLRANKLQVNIDMTASQVQTFENWVYNTIGQGSLQFTWPHPRLGVPVRATMVGDEPYSLQKMSPTYWKVSMTLIVYP